MASLGSASSRSFSLRAPIATEEERAHFQSRISFTALAVFVLAGGFWLAALVASAFLHPDQIHRAWTTLTSQAHLATTLSSAALWLATRSRPHSASVLGVVDTVLSVGLCVGWAIMARSERAELRPEYIGLLACTYTLVLRAATVPSTPARTGVLGLVAFAPLVLVTRGIYRDFGVPLEITVFAGLWSLLGVAATVTISQVIYGLRRQVRAAKHLGQYVLEEKIGEGGMGAVYRASHAMLRRPTAIKLLSEATANAVDRFEREVQITARLTHPNTIAIFDFGRTPEGVFYYAMEYVDGVSLEDLVATGPQPAARVVHILLQVCGALGEAHDAGLVHRDIKPANIMLTTRGGLSDVVKVLDFGLVKESMAESPSMTTAGLVLGTPHYMAPEAITDPASVDGRADLYALGATAFFLLTGQRVFDGKSSVEVCSKHLHEPANPPSLLAPGISDGLDDLVLACLAKKPKDRPASAAELGARLRALDVGAWTQTDATAWWSRHRELQRTSPDKAGTSMSSPKTVAVALEDRVA